MHKLIKISLLSLIVFILGIVFGSYYHSWVHLFTKKIWEQLAGPNTEVLYFCPPAKMVKEHQYNPDAFQVGKLYWQIDYHGWQAPENIGFMQALINKDNNLICYYQWPNPKDKGTNLWMTIHLSPAVNQEVKPYGSYWTMNKEEMNSLCTAGINACGFIISESSKRIIPQQ